MIWEGCILCNVQDMVFAFENQEVPRPLHSCVCLCYSTWKLWYQCKLLEPKVQPLCGRTVGSRTLTKGKKKHERPSGALLGPVIPCWETVVILTAILWAVFGMLGYIYLNLCWNLSVLALIIYYHMYFHLLPFCSNHFPPRSRAGRLLTRRQVTRIDTAGCGEAVEGPGWRCSTVIPSDLDGKCRHVGCPLVGKSVKFGEMVIYTSCETLLMIWGRFWNSGLWPQSGSSYTWGILCLELPTSFNRKEEDVPMLSTTT